MTWVYQGQELTEIPLDGVIGFVYKIKNEVNGRLYLGKKNFFASKTRQVKKKKKRYKVESDWKSYYGSNEELQADVARLGAENFTREILFLCKSKGEMSYRETQIILNEGALLSPLWYNSWVSCKIHAKHLKGMV